MRWSVPEAYGLFWFCTLTRSSPCWSEQRRRDGWGRERHIHHVHHTGKSTALQVCVCVHLHAFVHMVGVCVGWGCDISGVCGGGVMSVVCVCVGVCVMAVVCVCVCDVSGVCVGVMSVVGVVVGCVMSVVGWGGGGGGGGGDVRGGGGGHLSVCMRMCVCVFI